MAVATTKAGPSAGTGMIAGSVIGAVANTYVAHMQAKWANEINEELFQRALSSVQEQIGVSYGRTQTGVQEVSRDKIQKNMAIRRASIKAKGQVSVKAAQMGAAGKRGAQDVTGVAREAARAISDTERNAEIQVNNLVNHFNDTAQAAINNLYNNQPTSIEEPGIVTGLVTAGNAAMVTYGNMNALGKAQVKADLSSGFTKSIDAPQFSSGVRPGGR